MFKIHNDKVYFVAETPNINKVIEIFLPKDDRGTIMDSHEIRVDLCRAIRKRMTETATYSKNDVFYTCSLIEYIGRVTRNHRKDVVSALGTNGVKAILDSADVFHCQSFEQSADEICELFPVPEGTYDTVSNCHYKVPSYTDIGKVYQRIIFDCTSTPGVQDVIDVFSSFISDDISDFNTATYYCNPSYLYHSYKAGKLLD